MVGELAPALNGSALASFRDAFRGPIVLPADDGYDDARRVWNGMIDRRPALIARAIDVADIASAGRFGREKDLPIAVRSGGHSPPGGPTLEHWDVLDRPRSAGRPGGP